MKKYKITIVVPVYNVAPYIGDCLESVMNQTYQGEIECLLIDDCGTDNSMEIVADVVSNYRGKVTFKILHHKNNKGLSAARNTGIDNATGDYIYFLDSDDEIAPDCIEKLTIPLENYQYDFVIGGYRVTGVSHIAPPLLLADGTSLQNDDIIKNYYDEKWYMMVCGKLCNLAFIKKNHLLLEEGLIHEDELWSFQLACLAHSMFVVNRESYIYKIREGSITRNPNNKEKRAKSFQKILEKMIDFVLVNQIQSNYAYLFIFSMLSSFDEKLPSWVNIDNRERNEKIKLLRKQISRIPYSKRLSCCLTIKKKTILYVEVLLPVSFYHCYNQVIKWLVRKTVK